MPRTSCILILMVTAALAQSTPPRAATKPARAAALAEKSVGDAVAPSDAVITLDGLCAKTAQRKQDPRARSCKTEISRKDFETFVRALSATRGDVDPGSYRNAAEAYAQLVIASDLAHKAGVERDPRFAQILENARLSALGDIYRVQKFKELMNVPAGEVEAYYKTNIANYEEVGLDRFLLPKNNPANLHDLQFRDKSKKVADEMRARAVKGEDIYKLAKEGLEKLGVHEEPAIVPVGVRRAQVEDKIEREIFALGPDGVTPVLDGTGVWLFYKRTSRRTLPLDIVGREIKSRIFRDKLDALDKSLHDAVHVDYNEAYFGPSSAPAKPAFKNAPNDTANSKSAEAMKPSHAVITVHGLCGEKGSTQVSCTEVISREQFETLRTVKLLTTPSSAPPPPRALAQNQVDTLIYANAAERAGVEKDPSFPDAMNVARRHALSDMYRLKVDEDAHRISVAELESYYKKDLADFEQILLLHVSVPRTKPGFAKDQSFEARAKKLAAELRERAVKGEDMNKLQREAYENLGLTNPPGALMSPIRHGSLEKHTEQVIFALKPGGVTTVQAFPPAYVIYKLVSRKLIPLDEAKVEISAVLYQKNMEKFMKAHGAIRAELNQKYFADLSGGEASPIRKNALAAQQPRALK